MVRKAYIPWQWLVAPFFFLFAYHFLNKKPIKTRCLFYLISPFLIISIVHGIQLFYQFSINENHIIARYYERGLFLYTNLISFIHIPVVMYAMYKMIINYENYHRNKNPIEKIRSETSWLKNLIYMGTGIIILGILSVIIGMIFDMEKSFYAYPFFISLSLWIYWVGYLVINRSSSYKILEKFDDYSNSTKTGIATFNKINTYIVTEKKYLLNDINLSSIAGHFKISSGYLSLLVNTHTGRSFNDYINKLRIETSKSMLIDELYGNYTIESIGIECGFNSKSNFYTAFKKYSGQTPNQYKKQSKISSESPVY